MNHTPKSQIPGGLKQILYILKGFKSDSGVLIEYEEIMKSQSKIFSWRCKIAQLHNKNVEFRVFWRKFFIISRGELPIL